MPSRTSEEIEQLITLIPGVTAVRAVVEKDDIAEIHVLGDASRHPKQLVRDIESSLVASLGMNVDRRRISVAQLEQRPPEAARIVLDSLHLSLSSNEIEVKAGLSWCQRQLVGAVSGPSTSRGRLVLAARAVLQAVEQVLPAGSRLSLEALDTISFGGGQAVLVLVALIQNQQARHLVGAAFVRRDETEAAGRATLAAVNRRLAVLVNDN